MRLVYLLSADLDYGNTIAADTGPAYAARFGWPCELITDLERLDAQCVVVDNRLSERECAALPQAMARRPGTLFVLKIVDPYREWTRRHPWYEMLFAVARLPNVAFLSVYVPAEVTKDLDEWSGGDKTAVVPYPYPTAQEIDVPMPERLPRIFFSGNQNKAVYPYRHRFRQAARWWPPLRRAVDELPHPGYPDIGQPMRHGIIGRRYVETCAAYRFMFVSPSRYQLELLKYGECAAAGCVPIGEVPAGFPDAASAPFVRLDFESTWRLVRSARRALAMPADEVADRASGYRVAMRRDRDPARLAASCHAFFAERVRWLDG